MAGGTTRFDADTGQVFKETVVSLPEPCKWPCGLCLHPLSHTDHLKMMRHVRRPPGTVKGAASLKEMTLKSLGQNVSSISAETLQYVPSLLLDEIWQVVELNRQQNLPLWKMFEASAPKDGPCRYRQYICGCHCETPNLSKYISLAADLSSLCHVSLFLSHPGLRTSDYMAVTNLTNVRSIVVDQPFDTGVDVFDTRILRGWARAASERQAFPVLEVLTLKESCLTPRFFGFVNAFPRLGAIRLFHVQGNRDRYDAHSAGWDLRYWCRYDGSKTPDRDGLDKTMGFETYQFHNASTNSLSLYFDRRRENFNRPECLHVLSRGSVHSEYRYCVVYVRDFKRSAAHDLLTTEPSRDKGSTTNKDKRPMVKTRKSQRLTELLNNLGQ